MTLKQPHRCLRMPRVDRTEATQARFKQAQVEQMIYLSNVQALEDFVEIAYDRPKG